MTRRLRRKIRRALCRLHGHPLVDIQSLGAPIVRTERGFQVNRWPRIDRCACRRRIVVRALP